MKSIKILLLFLVFNMSCLAQNTARYVAQKIELPPNIHIVNCIEIGYENNTWVGTKRGFGRIEKSMSDFLTVTFDTSLVMPTNCLMFDKIARRKWVGTYTGVRTISDFNNSIRGYTINPRDKKTKKVAEGLINCLVPDGKGGVYVGGQKGILFHIINEEMRSIKLPSESSVNSIFVKNAEDRTILVGTSAGLYQVKADRKSDSIGGFKYVAKITHNLSNSFWVIGKNSKGRAKLIELNNGTIINHKLNCIPEGMDISYNDFSFDARSRLWIATNKGIIIYDTLNEECNRFLPQDDLIANSTHIVVSQDSRTAYLGVQNDLDIQNSKKGLYKIIIDLDQDICGPDGQKKANVYFNRNTSDYADSKKFNSYIEKVSEYLYQNETVRLKLISRTKLEHLSIGRLDKIKKALLRKHVRPNQIECIKEKDEKKDGAIAIEFEFICN